MILEDQEEEVVLEDQEEEGNGSLTLCDETEPWEGGTARGERVDHVCKDALPLPLPF